MPLSPEVQEYCRRLRQNDSSLTEIFLGGCRIGDEGALALSQAMPNNTFLRLLNMEQNNITDVGASGFANVLKTNKTLIMLNLEINKITDKGATDLSEILKTNSALEYLELGRNKIADKGAADLADALKINMDTKLRELWLGGNKIADKGATELANALHTNTKLEYLCLGGNTITDNGATNFAQALKINQTLQKLYLDENQIADVGATELLKALQDHNANLIVLEIGPNPNISDTTITQINALVEQNEKGTRYPLPRPLQAVAPIVARRSVKFVRSTRSLTVPVDPSSTTTMGDILDSLQQEDAQQTKVFVLGDKRKKRADKGEIFRVFSNDKTGSLTETRFRQETVAQLCALDDRQPISFQIEYKEVALDVSDDESE